MHNPSTRKQERQGEEGCERGLKMMCLQLPAVNELSQHPGPHWLEWLRVVPRALHSTPPPSSISVLPINPSLIFLLFIPLPPTSYLSSLFAVLLSFLFWAFFSQLTLFPSAKHPLHIFCFFLSLCGCHYINLDCSIMCVCVCVISHSSLSL